MGTDVATADDEDVAIPFGVVMVCLLQVGIGGWSALTGFALLALPSSVTSSVIGALMAFIGVRSWRSRTASGCFGRGHGAGR